MNGLLCGMMLHAAGKQRDIYQVDNNLWCPLKEAIL
jgi:hypothetical protein